MAKGNSILVSADARGRQTEGYINAALKPGTCIQLDVSEGVGNDGRFDWEAYSIASVAQHGGQQLVAVLLEDWGQGKLATDAYVSGDRCFLYFPIPGDELNMLVLNLAGTADDHAFGEVLMISDGDGKLIATAGTPESEPFQLLEVITDPTADTLAHVYFTGY